MYLPMGMLVATVMAIVRMTAKISVPIEHLLEKYGDGVAALVPGRRLASPHS
jgi:hypothetical protein